MYFNSDGHRSGSPDPLRHPLHSPRPVEPQKQLRLQPRSRGVGWSKAREEDVSTTAERSTGVTEHEAQQVERANASGRTPVVFIHGLWLLPSSWDRWATVFEESGFSAVAPGWPDDPRRWLRPRRIRRFLPASRSATSRTTSTRSYAGYV